MLTVGIKWNVILHERLEVLPMLQHVVNDVQAVLVVVPAVPLHLISQRPEQAVSVEDGQFMHVGVVCVQFVAVQP